MVDFANLKLPRINNKQALIDGAVAYHKQPRNAFRLDNGGVRVRVVASKLFCETAPRDPELNGVNNQLSGVDLRLFGSPELLP